jgi:hypothetical protein
MNLLLLKQISIISLFAGAFLGLITAIPYLGFISFIIAFFGLSAFVLIYLKKNDLIGIISMQEGAQFGAIIGFVSFIAFLVILVPVCSVLGLIFKGYSLGLFRYFFASVGYFVLFIFLGIFVAFISALMNGFTGAVTVYVEQMITGMNKENAQNNSIDFQIK